MIQLTRRQLCHGALGMAASVAPLASVLAGTPAGKNSETQALPIRFLGTGAADHHWRKIGQPGVRGSCSTLLDHTVLFDCGATGMANLQRFGIDPATLRALVFTHSHGDHFNLDEIVWDATMSDQIGDFRIFEHNDLAMIRHMEAGLRNTGCMHAGTRRVLSHMARTLWPEDPAQCQSLAKQDGWLLAEDGLELLL